MARLFLKKTLTGFAPADEPSAEVAKKFKLNGVYRADIVRPRSYQQHKLIFALLTLTYRNLPEQFEGRWPTFDRFRYAVAEEAGQFDEYVTLDGEIKTRVKSLSYDSMPDNVEFTKVTSAMMTICARILDINEPDLAAEVSKYCDSSYSNG